MEWAAWAVAPADTMYFPALENLIQYLGALPGVGRRSAQRIAFHILRMDEEQVSELSRALATVRQEIRFCRECGGLTDQEVCDICTDDERDGSLLCVVEEPGDIFAIERTGEYRGRYHVLGGALSPLDGVGPGDLRMEQLSERARPPVNEVFLATNPTLEGDATARYIADLLEDTSIKLTRISHGIPTGTTLEFADQTALARSIRGRRDFEE